MPLFALRSAGQYLLKPEIQAGQRDVPGDEPDVFLCHLEIVAGVLNVTELMELDSMRSVSRDVCLHI